MITFRRVGWGFAVLAIIMGVGVASAQSSFERAREAPREDDSVGQLGIVKFQVSNARGADRRVDYAALQALAPWDDRNYQLTGADLAFLSPAESESQDPVPVFYRVEMRKANPTLLKEGPAQYPRSALNGYIAKYGGYLIEGVLYTRVRKQESGKGFEILNGIEEDADRSGVMPNFLGGEARITSPAGGAESAISIHPTNSNLVIAGSNGPGAGQKMWYSSNGGVTWGGPVALANTCCDPAVGWSPDGSVAYAAALSTVVGGGTNVLFYRSTNNGQSWTLAKQLNTGNASDKEYFTVDHKAGSPYLGRIYMAWHDSNVQKFSYSTDGGLNWSAIQTLDSASRGIGSDLATDASGNLYFFFPTTSGGSNAKQIRMLKSTNGGVSFAAGVTVSATNADFDFPIPAMETRRAFIYTAADSDRTGGTYNGSVYVAWTDTSTTENNTTASANHAVVKVAYSRNGGSSWTVNNAHPSADISTIDRFNHWLSVDNTGRVYVMYYDTRNSTGRTGTDIYYVVSNDGAQTWSAPARLTSITSKNITDSFEWGDYNGMDAMMQNLIAIYTDNRDESGGTAQSIDVYSVGGFGGGAPPANVPPVANFSFTTSNLTATFTDSSSDSDGTIASRSWNFGDGGTSTATNPSRTYAAAGTYNVQLTVTDNQGASHSVTKSVVVSSGGGNTLSNGVTVSGLSGATGAEVRYTVAIPAGATNLNIITSGGTGDSDLYVRFGSAPTTTAYDCRPYKSGNAETCTFAAPQAGTYHVMLRGYAAFSGVSLTASWTVGGGGGGTTFFENTTDYTISDNSTIESPLAVTGSGNAPSALKVAVTIYHTYKGDLKVDLVAPDGSVYVLHNRTGGSADNIIQTYTVNASSELRAGTWKLRVNDNANGDTGYLDKWSLQF